MAGALLPGDASAHFNKDVGGGKYRIQMGFRDEPTYAGLPNALYLKVEQYATGGTKPVDDLASTLTAEVIRDGQTFSQPLVPIGDGQYEMRFVPTATGDYTFHVSGKIGDATVDESATSGPNTFDTVQPLSTIAFPASPARSGNPAGSGRPVGRGNGSHACHCRDRGRSPRIDCGSHRLVSIRATQDRGLRRPLLPPSPPASCSAECPGTAC